MDRFRTPRRCRSWLWVGLLACAAAVGVWRWQRVERVADSPLSMSLWYWHRPFRLSPEAVAELRAMGVCELFVLAGTLRSGKSGVVATQVQEWAGPSPDLGVHLVLNVHREVPRRFLRLDAEELVLSLIEVVRASYTRARRAGICVEGVQLDFDCPTRRLPEYGALLSALRPALAEVDPRLALSITALPTWFRSDALRSMLKPVDFYVPQFYEGELPKTLGELKLVSALDKLEWRMAQARRLRKPFFVGAPAYGHAFVFGRSGERLGMFRDLTYSEVARHSAFRLDRAFGADRLGGRASPETYVGEDVFDFVAVRPGLDGRGKGCHVVFDVPTPRLVSKHLAWIREHRPPNCRGVLWFRYPEADETLTLPVTSLAAGLRGDTAVPRLQTRWVKASAPWNLIETSSDTDRIAVDLSLSVTNVGVANTFVGDAAVELTLQFDRPGLTRVEPGDFEAAEPWLNSPHGPLRATPKRADTIRFRAAHLRVGETLRAGPVRVPATGATAVSGEWRVLGPGGFETEQGAVPGVSLNEEAPTE